MNVDNRHSHAVAEIDLAAIRHNYDLLTSMAPGLEGMAVVKANAYGHGVKEVVAEFEKQGVNWYGVATLDEAVYLRSLGIEKRILVFASPLKTDLKEYADFDLDICLASEEIARELIASSQSSRVHVKVDTGMGRLGLRVDELEKIFPDLLASDHINLVGLLSHFSEAEEGEEKSLAQLDEFISLVERFGDSFERVHLANSSGLARFRERLDLGHPGLLRLGIALYGYGIPSHLLRKDEELRPAMTLKSRITSIKDFSAGSRISYGGTWIVTSDTSIATVAMGYADGYPRRLSNWAQVKIGSDFYDVVGVVCMDMFMVDLKTQKHGHKTGDEVVLFGQNGPLASEISRISDTIPYELVTRIGSRVKKLFINPS